MVQGNHTGGHNGHGRGAADDLPRAAEVVVIGGGVQGASVAFQLAKRGVRDVTLLERRQLGAGATGKSGALVRAHYTNVPEARLTLESLRVFRNWDQEIGAGSPGFAPIGFLKIVTPEDEAALRANVADQQAIGVETGVVTAEEAREIEPLMRTDDFAVAAYEPNSGYADPNATLFGFVEAAATRGVRIGTGTEATAILRDGGAVVGVETTRGRIATRTVVLAGGAWANRLLAPLGVDLGLVPRTARVTVFRRPPGVDPIRRHRAVIDSINRSWFRPEGATGTLIGVEGTGGPADPDNYDEGVDATVIERCRNALAARFPAYAGATMRGGWSGMVMESPDSHPIVDQIPSVPGLFVMTGDSGSSFKTAPAIGICLAEWITGGAAKLVDLTPFRATRFAEGNPWHDEHAYGDRKARLTVSR